MLNIALFGPPGAGKGTQSEFLIKEFNLFYISTGDLLRKEIAAETKLGLEAQEHHRLGRPRLRRDHRADDREDDHRASRGERVPVRRLPAHVHPVLHPRRPDAEAEHVAQLPHQPRGGRGDLGQAPAGARQDVGPQGRQRNRHPQPAARVQREDAARARLLPGEGHLPARERQPVDRGRGDRHPRHHPRRARKHLVNVVVFGYPGSGRGSQSAALARKYGLEYVATGPAAGPGDQGRDAASARRSSRSTRAASWCPTRSSCS